MALASFDMSAMRYLIDSEHSAALLCTGGGAELGVVGRQHTVHLISEQMWSCVMCLLGTAALHLTPG